MAVLVKGMEMPEMCGECPFNIWSEDHEHFCAVRTDIRSFDGSAIWRVKHCPLIEVQEPHGDLIDREELQHIIGQFNLNWEYGQGVSDCWDALLNAPTIIPASEEGET